MHQFKEKASQVEVVIALYALILDAVWPAALNSCHLDLPTTMDCTFKLRAKINCFSFKRSLVLGVFVCLFVCLLITETRKVAKTMGEVCIWLCQIKSPPWMCTQLRIRFTVNMVRFVDFLFLAPWPPWQQLYPKPGASQPLWWAITLMQTLNTHTRTCHIGKQQRKEEEGLFFSTSDSNNVSSSRESLFIPSMPWAKKSIRCL